MIIDVPTLFVVLITVCGLVGTAFMVAWVKSRASDLFLRTGVAFLLVATGVTLILLRGSVPDPISIDMANAVLLFGLGIGWSAARRFEGRPTPPALIAAGAVVWLCACSFPLFHDELSYRAALMSGASALYSFACGYEFSRANAGQPGYGTQRWICRVFLFHGAVVTGRALFWLTPAAPASMFEANLVQGLLMVEPIIVVIGLALLFLALVRDRAESELRRTVETDHLTGALTRRALFAGAELLISRARHDQRPVVLLLFDLDHFKSINDRFGHAVGDRILTAFAAIARRTIRQDDLFGRIGGEEFAAILYGVDSATARLIADRIRTDFAHDPIVHKGARIAATVSVGVASSDPDADLGEMLERADMALYEAKRNGRDRVTSALAFAG
jgi:diguanylate cyclase (GGDEF)-like protein